MLDIGHDYKMKVIMFSWTWLRFVSCGYAMMDIGPDYDKLDVIRL